MNFIRCPFKYLLIIVTFLCLFSLVSCRQVTKPIELKQPNVLFIICDDLNDYQGAFGGHVNAHTPHIDALAKSSTQFANAHTNVPVCSPSRNSLFTGIYPHHSKDFGWTPHYKNPILKRQKTFVELFKENGYLTLGSGKLLHKDVNKIWDDWGVDRRLNYGPHAFNGEKMCGHPSVPEAFRQINIVDGSFAPLSDIPTFTDANNETIETGWTYGKAPFRYVNDNNRDLMPDEMHAQWATQKIRELEQRQNDQPFFMGIGFVNPHTPLYAPQKYFDMFPLDEIELPQIQEGDIADCFYKSVYPDTEMGLHYYKALREAYPDGDEGLRRFLQAYLACVAFVDDQVGVVIDALNNSKFKDNTIVIFTSDHGWQMGEKDYLYKNSPWEESTRIPLLVRHPQLSRSGDKVSHPVSLIDLYPSLVDLCHLEGSTERKGEKVNLDGYSLKPFLSNGDDVTWDGPDGALTMTGAGINEPIEGIAFCSNPSAKWHIEVKGELDDTYIMQQNYSYRTKDWRYIRYLNGKEELYHNAIDPYEWHNLALDDNYEAKKVELRLKVLNMLQN